MESQDHRFNSLRNAFEFDDRQYKPVLKPVTFSGIVDSISNNSEECISKSQRHVILCKPSDSGFGFNIIGGNMSEGIYVSFILAGGAADASKKVFKGDQILKVNNNDVSRMNHAAVVQLLKASGNQVNLILIHKPEEFRSCENHLQEFDNIMQSSGIAKLSSYNTIGSLRTTSKKTLYVRTLFNYDVNKDCGLPNKGLSFKFGDILHVTNASDAEWWQARRVNLETGEDSTDLGIIPSKARVERKNRSKQRKVRICTISSTGATTTAIAGTNDANNSSSNHTLSSNVSSEHDDFNLAYSGGSSSSNSSSNFISHQSLVDMKLGSTNSLPRSHHHSNQVKCTNNDNKKQTNNSFSSASSNSNNNSHHNSLFTAFKSNSNSSNSASQANNNTISGKSLSKSGLSSLTNSRKNSINNNLNSNHISTNGLPSDLNIQSISNQINSHNVESEIFYQPVIQDDAIPYRPVIILGAFKEELNATLLKENPSDFGICIPHTTRPMTADDVNGQEFHFVSTGEMDRLISTHQFIETGRSGPYLYGTSVKSVVEVMQSPKHCLLDVSKHAVRRLGLIGLWPIVLFIEISHNNNNSSGSTNCSMTSSSSAASDETGNLSASNKYDRIKHDFLPYITALISHESNLEDLYQKVIEIITKQNHCKIWLPSSFD